MSGRKHIGVEADKSLAEAFEHRCELAGLSKSEAIRQFMSEFVAGGSERAELESKLEDIHEDIERLESEKAKIESMISAKKSQARTLEDKIAELEQIRERYEDIVSSLAEVVSNGGEVRDSPKVEEAVELSEKSADEVIADIQNRAENEIEPDNLDISVRDAYDL